MGLVSESPIGVVREERGKLDEVMSTVEAAVKEGVRGRRRGRDTGLTDEQPRDHCQVNRDCAFRRKRPVPRT